MQRDLDLVLNKHLEASRLAMQMELRHALSTLVKMRAGQLDAVINEYVYGSIPTTSPWTDTLPLQTSNTELIHGFYVALPPEAYNPVLTIGEYTLPLAPAGESSAGAEAIAAYTGAPSNTVSYVTPYTMNLDVVTAEFTMTGAGVVFLTITSPNGNIIYIGASNSMSTAASGEISFASGNQNNGTNYNGVTAGMPTLIVPTGSTITLKNTDGTVNAMSLTATPALPQVASEKDLALVVTKPARSLTYSYQSTPSFPAVALLWGTAAPASNAPGILH